MATNDLTFRLVTSSKGTNKLSHDGNLYIFHRGIIKKEWRCEIRSCKARVHSVDDLIVKMSGEHFHSKENGKVEFAIAKENLRKRARKTYDNPHIVIGEETSSLSEAAKSLLPSQHALKHYYTCGGFRSKSYYKLCVRLLFLLPTPYLIQCISLIYSYIIIVSNRIIVMHK